MPSDSQNHLSFTVSRSGITNRILIPKYYDPELVEINNAVAGEYNTPLLGELLVPGAAGSRLGSWIRREHYGSGNVPFVRTSDFNNLRIRPDHKKSVALDVYSAVAAVQDVKANDILTVAHGTYLVGTVALVMQEDLPIIIQDHVFRLRLRESVPVDDPSSVDVFLILAALSTKFVRRQIRSRQFSADIIDKIGNRHLEIRVPIPRDRTKRKSISAAVREAVDGQTKVRASISKLLASDMKMTRERATARHGFSVSRARIQGRILVPKFYDPELRDDIKAAEIDSGVKWVSLRELVGSGSISVGTGVEVGKMAYGTGAIPFLRTTDIAELEVKADPRQGISTTIFDKYKAKAGWRAGIYCWSEMDPT
ncbi:hypothetical protein EAH79_16235 [Sphingomonas koreensis]|nr:hypothetical protein EAH79_16235 [Sphingomonas koreensis]